MGLFGLDLFCLNWVNWGELVVNYGDGELGDELGLNWGDWDEFGWNGLN